MDSGTHQRTACYKVVCCFMKEGSYPPCTRYDLRLSWCFLKFKSEEQMRLILCVYKLCDCDSCTYIYVYMLCAVRLKGNACMCGI